MIELDPLPPGPDAGPDAWADWRRRWDAGRAEWIHRAAAVIRTLRPGWPEHQVRDDAEALWETCRGVHSPESAAEISLVDGAPPDA